MDTTSNIQQPIINVAETPEIIEETEEELNIYPAIRHLFLTLCILLALSIIVFLIYQNGKSIYDKGL